MATDNIRCPIPNHTTRESSYCHGGGAGTATCSSHSRISISLALLVALAWRQAYESLSSSSVVADYVESISLQ